LLLGAALPVDQVKALFALLQAQLNDKTQQLENKTQHLQTEIQTLQSVNHHL
jgi:phosphoglycerate-specific signal transduction histidine kinase